MKHIMQHIWIPALLALAVCSSSAFAQQKAADGAGAAGMVAAAPDGAALSQTVADALGADPVRADAALQNLRSAGQKGLDAILAARPDLGADRLEDVTPAELQMRNRIDKLAMQKDAWVSGLFWYTSLPEAEAQAKVSGKPILSMRMLGNLNEDLSCANSRLFRTTLYANAQVGKFLRDHFVLHWESVRPVPVITIDMGDGRKMIRTITGNSIHYVLDSQGRLVDGLPGMYGAQAFMRLLSNSYEFAQQAGSLTDAAFATKLRDFHSRALQAETAAWQNDTQAVGMSPQAVLITLLPGKPTAAQASALTYSKGVMERPALAQVLPDTKALLAATPDEAWKKIAALHKDDVIFDGAAQHLIESKSQAVTTGASGGTPDKLGGSSGASFAQVLQNLHDSIAMDSVKNEYVLHKQIHDWLSQVNEPADLKTFNERVYAEIFLTPRSDPWLGLLPADTFVGLDNEGISGGTPQGLLAPAAASR